MHEVGRALAAADPVVSATGVLLGVAGVANTIFQAVRAAPRFFRYRLARRFFGFRNGQRVMIVCSELADAEARQWVEPGEFIYMLKYGDLDALYGMVWLIREIYPRCRLEVMSSREALSANVDFGCDLILIGGPDYNDVCGRMLRETLALVGYVEVPCDGGEPHIGLAAAPHPHWTGSHTQEDFGYIEVAPNPFARGRGVFFFGGCHTVGVTGATKIFQLNNEVGGGLTALAQENIRRLLRHRRLRRGFGAVFRVILMGATIPGPSLSDATLIGTPRRFLGLPLSRLAMLAGRLRVGSRGARRQEEPAN